MPIFFWLFIIFLIVLVVVVVWQWTSDCHQCGRSFALRSHGAPYQDGGFLSLECQDYHCKYCGHIVTKKMSRGGGGSA